VTIKANAKDEDKDTLTYNWVQTGGTTVTFTNGKDTINFTAPAANQVVTFSVIASDGNLASTPGTATITVIAHDKEKSGGALGWLTALLLPLAAIRRRMK
ncbi:MAG: PKD domain-containing protein, partial [Shewanella sp.]